MSGGRTFPLLVAHFLQTKTAARAGQPFQVTRQAMEALCAHDWPGNVRELENAIERAVTLVRGADRPDAGPAPAAGAEVGSAGQPGRN